MERIAIIQMTSSANPDENVAYIEHWAEQASRQGAELVVTPENALVFGGRDDYHRHAERLGEGPLQHAMSNLAKRLGLTLVVGSMPIRDGESVTTTLVVFGPDGVRIGEYSKLHMFDVDVADGHGRYRESDSFKAGNQVCLVESSVGCLGLSICYDLRFPALYQQLRQRGAEILLVPAAFTAVTGLAHWEVLLRARAIETQSWVLAAGQGGHHSAQRETWGHSMVIDPWGKVVAQLPQQGDLLIADIDLSACESIRGKMPVAQHSRFTPLLDNER
ncbi:carbon-nitrogen hydrolase family protein [Vibrio sp. IRLE0018]|uniref:carbon-nitrogen hydrolase family protein n=1 Tax=Vibrio TaxID=662 RepID=UPI001594C074|nr:MULTISPECIES: carbon-nitrogen hydrolase family protein [Vibrio]MCF8780479.1 carbon-nitrogen hydrolase family protein [Vibrio floridensis]NVC64150.1 carbon-nitrogen hydrolase family protein [Vibrio sp. 05-20-BW147]